MYVSYDLRSAQKFIFRIPLLQAAIGGSGLIVHFDEWASNLARPGDDYEALFTGAGHGLFSLSSAEGEESLRKRLVRQAHEYAMDIRVGVGASPEEATSRQLEYSYLPAVEEMPGPPCYVSGQFPFNEQTAGAFRGKRVNARVFQRFRLDGQRAKAADLLDERVWAAVRERQEACSPLQTSFGDARLEFFRAVTATRSDDAETQAEAELGRAALGSRNRWAVIAMDGNGIGAQFARAGVDRDAEQALQYRRCMSTELMRITSAAATAGIVAVASSWAERYPEQRNESRVTEEDGTVRQVLPIRPLILGGDDLVFLCHAAFAFDFVLSVCSAFEKESEASNSGHSGKLGGNLWPASKGWLTISAGIVFTSTSFPLHMSIRFAEELLHSAKEAGQRALGGRTNVAAPASLDWESLTEGHVDGLAARRRREYEFLDCDLPAESTAAPEADARGKSIRLTGRPYTTESFIANVLSRRADLQNHQLPRSVLADVFPAMRAGYFDRMAYRVKLAKHQPWLAEGLREVDPAQGHRVPARLLHILDAIDVFTEEARLERETV